MLTPITEGGNEYNLADVLVALHGADKAADIMYAFITSPLAHPVLSQGFIDGVMSEIERISDI